MLCYACGKVGHTAATYPLANPISEESQEDQVNDPHNDLGPNATEESNENDSQFGPWNQVVKPARRTKPQNHASER